MNKAEFQRRLARGLEFERKVARSLLHELYPNYWINNFAKDPSTPDGPRIYRGADREDVLVLPDFHLWHPKYQTVLWVDAKLKTSPYSDQTATRPTEKFLTLDRKSHQKYLKFNDEVPGVLLLMFGVESTQDIYLIEWNAEPETVEYNNQHGVGATPIYYINDMKHVGTF